MVWHTVLHLGVHVSWLDPPQCSRTFGRRTSRESSSQQLFGGSYSSADIACHQPGRGLGLGAAAQQPHDGAPTGEAVAASLCLPV